MASLSKYFGSEGSRTMKKTAWLTMALIGVYSAVCIIGFTLYMIDLMTSGSDWMFGSRLPDRMKGLIFFFICNGIWLVWLPLRAFHKYAERKDKIMELSKANEKFKEWLITEGFQAVQGIEKRIVVNQGARMRGEDDDVYEIYNQQADEIMDKYQESLRGLD